MRFVILVLAVLLLFPGVTMRTAAAQTQPDRSQSGVKLAEMIGQMIVVGFVGTSERNRGVRAVFEQIASNQIGGVLLLGRNIANPEQTLQLTSYLHSAAQSSRAPVPLISIDQEGGAVQRLTTQKGFGGWFSAEHVAALNAEHGQAFAITYYEDRAASLAETGINLNFGPVLDLDTNPANPIIGQLKRSYSNNAEVVSTIGGDFVIAHRNAGIVTSLKHFPGHGSSRSDSHRTLPDVSNSWTEDELLPYLSLKRRGLVDTVMMAHVYHPDFSDGALVPSSMSQKAVRAARAIVGADTVLISDDMQMGAITNQYRESDAAIRAINAGVDMLVYSSFSRDDPDIGPRINKAIVDAVARGDITRARIERAYTRIMALKATL